MVNMVCGERQELVYLPCSNSGFDGYVILRQSGRSIQSSFDFFHLLDGDPNAFGILAVEALDSWVLTSPGHPQRALQNHPQTVQYYAVPFLLQGRPAALDRIV